MLLIFVTQRKESAHALKITCRNTERVALGTLGGGAETDLGADCGGLGGASREGIGFGFRSGSEVFFSELEAPSNI